MDKCPLESLTWGLMDAAGDFGRCVPQQLCPSQSYNVDYRICCNALFSVSCIGNIGAQLTGTQTAGRALLLFSRPVFVSQANQTLSLGIQGLQPGQYRIQTLGRYNQDATSQFYEGIIISIELFLSVKAPVLVLDVLDAGKIVDRHGLSYPTSSPSHFTLQLPDFIYHTLLQVTQSESSQLMTDSYSYVIAKLFSFFFLINMCNSLTTTYDTVLLFSMLRYLNVLYPLNLQLFFEATDQYKLSLSLLAGKSQDQVLTTSRSISLFGQSHAIYDQESRPKFFQYGKGSSFLLNGLGLTVNLLGSILLALCVMGASRAVKFAIHRRQERKQLELEERQVERKKREEAAATSGAAPRSSIIAKLVDLVLTACLIIQFTVCFSLPIKQLTTNAVHWFLSVFLQFDHIDLSYRINVSSAMACLLSFLLIGTAFRLMVVRNSLTEQRLRKMKMRERRSHIVRFESNHIKLDLRCGFYQSYQIINTGRKMLFMLFLVFLYDYPVACICYALAQQVVWVACFSVFRLQRAPALNFMYTFGEIQLLLTEVLVLVIHSINERIRADTRQIIDQELVNMRFQLGWVVIALFLLQNLIDLLCVLRATVPKVYQIICLLATKIFKIYYDHVYLVCLVPLLYVCMNRHPRLFALTRGVQAPIRSSVEALQEQLQKLRESYRDLGKGIKFAHLMYLPEELCAKLIVREADEIRVFRALDFLAIVNNLNPETLSYEDLAQTTVRFAWVFHPKFCEPVQEALSQQLELIESSTENLVQHLSTYLNNPAPEKLYCELMIPPQALSQHCVDYAQRYGGSALKLLQYHIIAEMRVSQQRKLDRSIPWQILQDLRQYGIDLTLYQRLVSEALSEPTHLLLKLLDMEYTMGTDRQLLEKDELEHILELVYKFSKLSTNASTLPEQDLRAIKQLHLTKQIVQSLESKTETVRETGFKVYRLPQGAQLFQNNGADKKSEYSSPKSARDVLNQGSGQA